MRRRSFLASVVPVTAGLRVFAQQPLKHPMPAFRARSLTGETFTNASLRGKIVLIQFWATWCTFCRRDQPAVERIVKDYASKGVIVLGISVREPRATVRTYLASSPRSCKIIVTEDTNLVDLFELRGFPSYLVLNPDGDIVAAQEGATGYDGLKEILDAAGVKA